MDVETALNPVPGKGPNSVVSPGKYIAPRNVPHREWLALVGQPRRIVNVVHKRGLFVGDEVGFSIDELDALSYTASGEPNYDPVVAQLKEF